MKNIVLNYFNRIAYKYNKKSNSFPWILLRRYESKHLISLIPNKDNLKVLDMGCGSGFYADLFSRVESNSVFAVDLSKTMLQSIKNKKISTYLGDASSIKFKTKFDIIICAGLLEFVLSVNDVLINARNHSNDQTNLLILLPKNNFFGKIYKKFHYNHGINIKLFDLLNIENLLNDCGWKIIKYKKIFPFSIAIYAKLIKS